MTIKRFDFHMSGFGENAEIDVEENSYSGDYCKYDEHKKIADEKDAEIAQGRETIANLLAEVAALKKQRTELVSALELATSYSMRMSISDWNTVMDTLKKARDDQ